MIRRYRALQQQLFWPALAESLNPEDMSDLVRDYQAGVKRCVERYQAMFPATWATAY